MPCGIAADGCAIVAFLVGAGCNAVAGFFRAHVDFRVELRAGLRGCWNWFGESNDPLRGGSRKGDTYMNVTLASAWDRTRLATRGVWVALALSACGQSTTDGAATTTVTDTASAYLALSEKVERCEEAKDACVTAAAGDTAAIAACEAEAESCLAQTNAAQGEARRRLRDDAEGCVRECRGNRGDSDGGVDEDGPMDTRGCMGRRRAAVDSQCFDDLFACLDATGILMSGGTGQIDDATREAITACVETAHTCAMSDMRSRRGPRSGGRNGGGAAGEPSGDAGAGADRDGRGPGRRGPRAEAGASADAGADADDDDSAGRRGRNRGAAGGDPGRGRRDGAAGAAGN